MEIPEGANLILGQSHFIKTVEDLYEALIGSGPHLQFGIAFSEASGPCLVRAEGNDGLLKQASVRNSLAMGCGHTFVILMKGGFPINVLRAVHAVPEVCTIFCATANPLEVVVAVSEQGRGVMGVIDGSSPLGTESEADVEHRHQFLRKIGYKR
jgi:adenosine/AMP kinase